MTPTDFHHKDLEAIAWGFLESDFAGPVYTGWPIDRRVEVYLLHRGLSSIANDGSASAAVVERVMANIGPAMRRGILNAPKRQDQS